MVTKNAQRNRTVACGRRFEPKVSVCFIIFNISFNVLKFLFVLLFLIFVFHYFFKGKNSNNLVYHFSSKNDPVGFLT